MSVIVEKKYSRIHQKRIKGDKFSPSGVVINFSSSVKECPRVHFCTASQFTHAESTVLFANATPGLSGFHAMALTPRSGWHMSLLRSVSIQ